MKFTSKTNLADMQVIRDALLDQMTDPGKLPIRYRLDGKLCRGIPPEFSPRTTRRIIDANIAERIYSCRIPNTPLSLRIECQEYKDFPVWEWTAYFENVGEENSPVISDFMGIDAVLPGGDEVILYHNNGDYCSRDGLETTECALEEGQNFTAASFLRPCMAVLPDCHRRYRLQYCNRLAGKLEGLVRKGFGRRPCRGQAGIYQLLSETG